MSVILSCPNLCNFAIIGDSWAEFQDAQLSLENEWGVTGVAYGYGGNISSTVNTQPWTGQVTSTKPEVIVFTYGVNDYYQDIDPAVTLQAAIKQSVAIAQSQCPNSVIAFFMPAEPEGNGNPAYPWSAYVSEAQACALNQGIVFFDIGTVVSPYTPGDPNWVNGAHLSPEGYAVMASSAPALC